MHTALETYPRVRVEKMKYPDVRYYSYQKRLVHRDADEIILYNSPGLAITDHLRGGGFYLPTQSVTWCSTERWNSVSAVFEREIEDPPAPLDARPCDWLEAV